MNVAIKRKVMSGIILLVGFIAVFIAIILMLSENNGKRYTEIDLSPDLAFQLSEPQQNFFGGFLLIVALLALSEVGKKRN